MADLRKMLKFRLSEKHTKFEKVFLMVLTNQLIYLVNVKTMRKIFFKLFVLLKKSELYCAVPMYSMSSILETKSEGLDFLVLNIWLTFLQES